MKYIALFLHVNTGLRRLAGDRAVAACNVPCSSG
ncbi:hypothetical protein OKW42_000752 [Paraburkholderia sp. WC7.3d]